MGFAPRPPVPAWETVADGGRPFLRMALPGETGETFTIAATLAGRYRAEDLLAVGEVTVLLVANDIRTRKRVLIKALRHFCPPVEADRPGPTVEVRHVRHLLQTERRLLVRLRNAGCNGVPHPNDYVYDRNPALTARDESVLATEPYLIMEYVAGITLEELLSTTHPEGMDVDEALRLIGPVVEVLEVLHEPWRLQGGRTWHCIYQDLKPSNLLVEPTGHPRLLDFGGCQVVIDGVPVLEGSCTAGYRPPECEGPGEKK